MESINCLCLTAVVRHVVPFSHSQACLQEKEKNQCMWNNYCPCILMDPKNTVNIMDIFSCSTVAFAVMLKCDTCANLQ